MKENRDRLQLLKDSFLKIWNDRMAGTVYTLYLHNARIIHGLRELIYGREAYLSRIIGIHSMLPDLSFSIENSFLNETDDPEREKVYLRWVLEGTHLNTGIFGKPTGRKIRLTGMTVCHLCRGMITEQWEVWNSGSLFDQLDVDWDEYLEQFFTPPPVFDPLQFGETGRIIGQDLPEILSSPAGTEGVGGEYITGLLHNIWNSRSPGIVTETHSENCTLNLPGDYGIKGSKGYSEFVFSMISVFPDLRIYVDEIITNLKNSFDGTVAVRCTLQGFNSGNGKYGAPANRQVTIPVIIQYKFEKKKVKNEWFCMSEFDLIKYLYSYRRHAETEAVADTGEDGAEA